MEKRQRVLLYGDTLMLASVRTSFRANPAFEVIALETSQAAEQDLLALGPDIIIFDTSSVQPRFHYNLIKQRGELLLIGIDPDSNQIILWSGQHMCELSLQDLAEVILQQQSRFDLFKKDKK